MLKRCVIVLVFLFGSALHSQTIAFEKLNLVPFHISSGRVEFNDGQKVNFPSSQKLYVVDFWATWCNQCMSKLNYLVDLKQSLGTQFTYWAVNAGESRRALKKFAKKLHKGKLRNSSELNAFFNHYKMLWDQGRKDTKSKFKVDEIPTLLLVDRRGKILFRAQKDHEFKQFKAVALKHLKN